MDGTEDNLTCEDLVGSSMKKTEGGDEHAITDDKLNDYYNMATEGDTVTEQTNERMFDNDDDEEEFWGFISDEV